MTFTDTLRLKKPDAEDFYDVGDFNENFDAIDAAVKNSQIVYITTSELKALIEAGTANKNATYAVTDYISGDFDGSSGGGGTSSSVEFADDSDLFEILETGGGT